MKKLLIILAIILLPSMALANFSVTFENTFDKKMYYILFWVDHPFDWPTPANLAGGELGAFKSHDLRSSYKHGKYFVVWQDGGEWLNEMLIVIEKDVTEITITPIRGPLFKKGG